MNTYLDEILISFLETIFKVNLLKIETIRK